jgi:hydrogenase maturation factor
VSAGESCGSQHCITCGDDGVPMSVVAIDLDRGLALCAHEDGRHETVETALVDSVAPGDTLLVHAGTALANLRRRRQAPPTISISRRVP